ncbi:Formate/nitrite transporter [Amylocystis lapponica]|nr:Formate/nitrite transporter [Amylocystis lapponica]
MPDTAAMDPPSTLRPAQVAQAMIEHGIAKHRTRADLLFFKAFLAGVMLSFGGLLSEIVGGGSAGLNDSNPGLVKFLSGAVFPVGLVMIVLQGHELLTSNMMIFSMALIKRAVPWWALPAQLDNRLFFAAILVRYSGVISTAPYNTYVVAFAPQSARASWHQIFLRGIGCNWLVCVAVWQAAGARDTLSKIVAIWIPIMIFVTAGYDHVVANMFSIPLGIMFGADVRPSCPPSSETRRRPLRRLPAVYFYLLDHDAGGLRAVEEGEGLNGAAAAATVNGGASPDSAEKREDEEREVYEAQSKRAVWSLQRAAGPVL